MSKKKRKPPQRTRTAPKPKMDLPALAAAFKKVAVALEEAKKKQAEMVEAAEAKTTEKTVWPKFDNVIIEMPDERYGLGFPTVEGTFSAPDKTVTHGDRIKWYWYENHESNDYEKLTVVASYIKSNDMVHVGQWVIDILGTTRDVHTSAQAKFIAEALLSAIGWESIWRNHYVEPKDDGPKTGVPLEPKGFDTEEHFLGNDT